MPIRRAAPTIEPMLPEIRMIDANLNRAREGLRVMEDVARFALNSSEIAGAIKDLRHRLRGAAETLAREARVDTGMLAANRDVAGDVGTAISTDAEYHRRGLADVAAASIARAAEALRVIEESTKSLAAPETARLVESIRYGVYDAGRRLTLALGTGGDGVREGRRQWSLCVLITERLCQGRDWRIVAEHAIQGGADCLQLREKELPDSELLRRAKDLVAISRAGGASAVVNDRVDIAILSGADGVHIGQEDLAIAEVRRLAGFSLLVGVSTGNLRDARAAVEAGADLCGVGPMFETTTKHKPSLAGVEYLRAYLAGDATSRVPHLAIGGITPENIGRLAAVGCRGVAVSSCVCSASDPAGVCRDLRRGLSVTSAASASTG